MNSMGNGKKEANLKLTSENRQAIRRIKFYLESHYVDEGYLEGITSDIVGMALESQKRGEDFSKTVGLDYAEFSKELAENAPRQTYAEKIFNIIISTVACVGIVLPVMYVLGFIFRIRQITCRTVMLVAPLAFILKYMLIVFVIQVGWILVKRSIYKSQTFLVGVYVSAIVLAVILSDYITMLKPVYELTVEVNIFIWLAAFLGIIGVLYFVKLRIVSLTNFMRARHREFEKKRGR